MSQSYAKQSAKGALWSMVERFSTMGIQLLCTIIIARFLSPDQFGLVGMISIFMAFSMVIIDSGFAQALIRDREPSQLDYSSVFYFNILVGTVIYIVAYILAPYISIFYKEPLLTLLIRVSFISMICLSLSVVQQARLFKNINFATVSKISLISAILSGFSGIYCAYLFNNVWALIIQSVSFSVIRTMLFWIFGKWYPSFLFSWSSIKKYLSFSLNLLGTNMIASITDNLPNLLIGKYFNASILAYYTLPEKLQRSIAGTISFSIHRVSYPIMSSVQNDKEYLLSYCQKVVGMAFFIISPLMLIIGILSKPLIFSILSDEWIESAIYLRYLAIFGALYCFADINMDILIVRGKTKQVFYLELIRKLVFVLCLIVGTIYSIKVLLLMLVLYQLFNSILVSYYAEKELNGSLADLILSILPNLYCLIPMGILCAIVTKFNIPNTISVIIGFITSIIIYLIIAYITKNPYLLFCFSQLKQIIKHNNV